MDNKIIFTNGCFDILHLGHINLLKFCKSLNGLVIVGLNSDNSIKRLKGPNRPINNQITRKAILESIRYVDNVIIFDQLTPLKLIESIKPDIIVKGSDYDEKNVIGNHIAKVILFDYMHGHSTTKTIQSILDS